MPAFVKNEEMISISSEDERLKILILEIPWSAPGSNTKQRSSTTLFVFSFPSTVFSKWFSIIKLLDT